MLNPDELPVQDAPRYPDAQTFLSIHNEWVKVEMERELSRVRDFNDAGKTIQAHLLHLHDAQDEIPSLIIRANFSGIADIAPKLGERCQIQLLDISKPVMQESSWARAIRVPPEHSELPEVWDSHIDLSVEANRVDWEEEQWRNVLGKPIIDVCDDVVRGLPKDHYSFRVRLTLRPSTVTFEAERATLREAEEIWRGTTPKKAVLDTMILCKKARRTIDLAKSVYKHLPLNSEWDHIMKTQQNTKAFEVLNRFNPDQRQAFKLLRVLPDGLAFVPGCPGSGKTTWALEAVGLAQCGTQKAQTLYLLDINNTVDDAADRMAKLYRRWGLSRTVIRMTGWGKVLQKSKKCAEDALQLEIKPRPQVRDVTPSDSDSDSTSNSDADSAFSDETDDDEADFRRNFAIQAVKNLVKGYVRDAAKAFTLDEAAWKQYDSCPGKYPEVAQHLADFIKQWEKDDGKDAVLDAGITTPLSRLYRDALRQADFIATTPVAAQNHLRFLRPDLVVFDEAGHAREVSTLMSIVYFQPKAWIFVGDYRQIRPYVSRPDKRKDEAAAPYLFCISAMERLALNKLAHRGLLINHRARAGLQQLPSKIFYNEEMTSGIALEPSTSTRRFREHLDMLRGHPSAIPRLVVNMYDAQHHLRGTSSYNPDHQAWVMARIGELLRDDGLKSIDQRSMASILIVSPYKAAVQEYEDAIETQFPVIGPTRVMARTTNTAQGIEADIVIVDLVRATSFCSDPRRLCVALTRARQAEIILLNRDSSRGFFYLRQIWDEAEEAGQTKTVSKNHLTTVSEW